VYSWIFFVYASSIAWFGSRPGIAALDSAAPCAAEAPPLWAATVPGWERAISARNSEMTTG
jgi:hypothetical protein